jgi:hypothetical protein
MQGPTISIIKSTIVLMKAGVLAIATFIGLKKGTKGSG